MKTVIKDELTEAEAREAHKADILSGNDGVETGKRAGLIAAEIAQHRADFSARKRAAETLTVTVPKLQEQADGLERASRPGWTKWRSGRLRVCRYRPGWPRLA